MISLLKRLFSVNALSGHTGRLADTTRAYLPELTGLRAIAIIVIVWGHLFQRIERSLDPTLPMPAWQTVFFTIFATPFTGCCIFFVVSGYVLLISRPLRSISLFDIHKYIGRRILYVIVPYYIILIVSYLAITLTNYQPLETNSFFAAPSSLTRSLFASLTFTHMLIYGTFPRLFPPGWFIETQVQFYIVGPYLWHLYSKLAPGPRRLPLGISILCLSMIISALISVHGPRNLSYSILTFLPYFWAGALIADFRSMDTGRSLAQRLHSYPGLGWVALLALIALGAPLINSALFYLTGRIVILGLLFSSAFTRGSFRRFLTHRVMIRIGVATLSIFLVHLQVLYIVIPFLTENTFASSRIWPLVMCSIFGLLVVAVVSLAFYWLVERPLLVVWRRDRFA